MQYNFILETGSPGGLWVSTGSSPLTKVFTGSLGGNGGTDWHVGESRLASLPHPPFCASHIHPPHPSFPSSDNSGYLPNFGHMADVRGALSSCRRVVPRLGLRLSRFIQNALP